jgi:hypothetical protein
MRAESSWILLAALVVEADLDVGDPTENLCSIEIVVARSLAEVEP